MFATKHTTAKDKRSGPLRSSWRLMAVLGLFFAAGNVGALGSDASDTYVWWEGETPVATNFPRETSFSASTFPDKREGLSGGDWLSNEGQRKGNEAFARYETTVPSGGTFEFWSRKFWKHGPFRWRFDEGPWRTCGRDVALADTWSIRKHLGANWVFLGDVELAAGPHTFELRLLAMQGEALTACFDCFVLSSEPFLARGKLKPGERSGKADAGFFPWEPTRDPFSKDALLDLRYLNEAQAGESGFVGADGDRFVLGNGEAVKFWALNGSRETAGYSRTTVDYLARRLAKVGVNMVRYHSFPGDNGEVATTHIDAKDLDNLLYFVSSMKRQGIYTSLSFYFPLWFKRDGKTPFAQLYFDPTLQGIYKGWAKEILTTPNPYTGTPLAKETAVAMVEIINEDSFFFWTFAKKKVGEEYWTSLERLFTEWVTKRYNGVPNAYRAWGQRESGDSDTHVTLYDAWHMTGDGFRKSSAAKKKRLRAQIRFLQEHQRKFYKDMRAFFREDLGVGGLISASNWHTADPAVLDAVERYTYAACDVMDRHGYFGGMHEGEGSSYSVRVGHTFENKSALKHPQDLPLQGVAVEGFPHMISEIGWTNPNLYRADYAFLASAYGSLQGLDCIVTFSIGSASWDQDIKKFAASCPVILGNFPAHALLYRRGDVKEGAVVLRQPMTGRDTYRPVEATGLVASVLDKFRQSDVPKEHATASAGQALDPLAVYVGRVTHTYDSDAKAVAIDLEPHIDREGRTVKSLSGELNWDYGEGLATMDTAMSQGATGFLAQRGNIQLSHANIACDNEYGSVTIVSLDGKPLASSSRILIQVMTVERPYGFRSSKGRAGGTITDLGGAPFGLEKIRTAVTLKLDGPKEPKVTALDAHGYARSTPVNTSGSPAAFKIELLEDSVYYVVER